MQTRKISSKLTLILYTILEVFVCLSAVAITTTSNQTLSTQAAENTKSVTVKGVTFTKPVGLETNLYCVITFYGANGSFTEIIKSNDTAGGNALSTTGAGKLEVTVPMYCSVSGLSNPIQNGSTYYVDVNGVTEINITVTFNDQGYFGGNTLGGSTQSGNTAV